MIKASRVHKDIFKTIKKESNAKEKPNMPIIGHITPPFTAASTNNVPIIGPVQENETNDKVNAIKNIPNNPPLSDIFSDLLIQEDGNVNSKKPKNDIANNTKSKKKNKLKITLVDKAFKASAPNSVVTP